jgi:hypothetical protein
VILLNALQGELALFEGADCFYGCFCGGHVGSGVGLLRPVDGFVVAVREEDKIAAGIRKFWG